MSKFSEIYEGVVKLIRPATLNPKAFEIIKNTTKGIKYPVKIKQDENMLTITFKDTQPTGVTSMGGVDTLLGQELKKYKATTKKAGEDIIKQFEKAFNIEDSEVEEGKLFAVSDDFMI